eukprot:Blabericola_migrator_1__5381@NODE_2756_length_2388_cov_6_256786_g1725_i0_p1_GENE_NODE_2756_length_2388_cov_6_256786_g1725_i0NODE_2756_length_2388_cov_6_256786_g1725_i0_p1_ORF_typecomplete_len426_score89_26PAM2/PF07145_15/0_026_NODE_2756_length_2388_cov_6_256786_g1725_i0181295
MLLPSLFMLWNHVFRMKSKASTRRYSVDQLLLIRNNMRLTSLDQNTVNLLKNHHILRTRPSRLSPGALNRNETRNPIITDLVKGVREKETNESLLLASQSNFGLSPVLTPEELDSIRDTPNHVSSEFDTRWLRRRPDFASEWATLTALDEAVDLSYSMGPAAYPRVLDYFLSHKHLVINAMCPVTDAAFAPLIQSLQSRVLTDTESKSQMAREQFNSILNFKVILSGSVVTPSTSLSCLPFLGRYLSRMTVEYKADPLPDLYKGMEAEFDLLLSAIMTSMTPKVRALMDDFLSIFGLLKPLVDLLSKEAVSILLVEFLARFPPRVILNKEYTWLSHEVRWLARTTILRLCERCGTTLAEADGGLEPWKSQTIMMIDDPEIQWFFDAVIVPTVESEIQHLTSRTQEPSRKFGLSPFAPEFVPSTNC